MSDNEQIPPNAVVFDIEVAETEQRDKHSKVAPFFAAIGGRRIEFRHPEEIDWNILAGLGDDPLEFVELCVKNEDEGAWLMGQSISSGAANKLVDSFMRHYGMTRRGNRGASRR